MYSHLLNYENTVADKTFNDSAKSIDPIKKLFEWEVEKIISFRKQQKKMLYPPIKICKVPGKGLGVRAFSRLNKNTVIAEYVGDIMTTEEFLNKKDKLASWGSDSIFTLLQTNKISTSLEIVPYKHTNIARFLNSAKLTKGLDRA